jgi:predicted TIM-barrel fold metal-dependent hydrolase
MIIDVHGHVTSPELFKRFPMPPSLADIGGMIEAKAAVGIDMTIVGSPVGAGTMVPVKGLDNYAQPVDQLNAFHDWLAGTVQSHKPFLRGYVYVNPLGDERLLSAAERWLAEDEFVGLIANTSIRGEYLDSPQAEPFFALAHRTGSPVLLHPPAQPVGAAEMRGHLGLIEHIARPCDITMGVAALLFAGWLDRYPGLKIIIPNAGGALSLLAEKLDLAWRRGGPPGPRGADGPPGPPDAQDGVPPSRRLRDLYVDSATPSALSLAAAVSVFGPRHVLFGTDSPPLTAPLPSGLAMLDALPVQEADKLRILSGNAAGLFGLPVDGPTP